jgi:hypothetical protein
VIWELKLPTIDAGGVGGAWEKRDRLEVFQIAFAKNPAKKEFT